MSLVFVRRNQIKTRKKTIKKSSRPGAYNLFSPAQWDCHERRIILYIIPIPLTNGKAGF